MLFFWLQDKEESVVSLTAHAVLFLHLEGEKRRVDINISEKWNKKDTLSVRGFRDCVKNALVERVQKTRDTYVCFICVCVCVFAEARVVYIFEARVGGSLVIEYCYKHVIA